MTQQPTDNDLLHLPTEERAKMLLKQGDEVAVWGMLRLTEILDPWYRQVAEEAHGGAVLNADETGWRVNGKTHWLWCFTTPALTYYASDPTRSGEVPRRLLADCFAGTLVSDFFGAYNRITGQRQMCLAHLLRELKAARDHLPHAQGAGPRPAQNHRRCPDMVHRHRRGARIARRVARRGPARTLQAARVIGS